MSLQAALKSMQSAVSLKFRGRYNRNFFVREMPPHSRRKTGIDDRNSMKSQCQWRQSPNAVFIHDFTQ
jgi:hypothetical protein